MLTTDIDTYRRDGVLHPLQGLPPDRTRHYLDCLRRDCALAERPVSDAGIRQPQTRVKPYLLFPWAAELVREPVILDAVSAVIGPDILVFHTTIWWKPAGSEGRVPWHQDATYFGLAPHEHVHRLGRADRQHAPVRLRPHPPRLPPPGAARPRRPERPHPDAVPRAERPRPDRRGGRHPDRAAGRPVLAPRHAGTARLGPQPRHPRPHRRRHQLHPDARPPHRADPAVRHPGPRHRPPRPLRPTNPARPPRWTPQRLPPTTTPSPASGAPARVSPRWPWCTEAPRTRRASGAADVAQRHVPRRLRRGPSCRVAEPAAARRLQPHHVAPAAAAGSRPSSPAPSAPRPAPATARPPGAGCPPSSPYGRCLNRSRFAVNTASAQSTRHSRTRPKPPRHRPAPPLSGSSS